MFEDVGRDALARREDRDAGRIAHHELAGDAAERRPERHRLLLRDERGLGRHGDVGVDVFVVEEADGILAVQALDLGERGDEPLDVHAAVARRDDGEDVADVAELDLDAVVVAEQVVHLDAGLPDVARVDRQLRQVEREARVAVADLGAERVVAAEAVDLLARVLREGDGLFVDLAAVEVQVAAREIKRAQQQVVRARRLRQRDHLAHIVGVDRVPAEEDRALRERAARLVERDGRHVAARRHARDRQPVGEIEMRAVRLARQHLHPRRVRDGDDRLQVGAHAVVRRVVDEDGLRVGVLLDGALHILHAHPQRDAEPRVAPGVDVDGDRAVDDERVDGAAVDVARHDDLFAAAARRPDHRLDGGRGAVHHEEGVIRAERLRRERLRIPDDADGMAQVVERLHGVDVERHAQASVVLGQLGIHAPALVAGHVEMRQTVDPLRVQRLRERRSLLCKVRQFM